jgi:uncharacterized YigZ family protein
MTIRYPIPDGIHRVEEEISRSRFITTLACTPTVEAAREFIAARRVEFPDASHNCWAYLVGPPGSSGQVGYGDDGEPHGTAGRPMLTVLQHCGVGDITAVTTRYFGGVLLGRGGLVRAYSGGVKLALETLPLAEHRPLAQVTLVVGYEFVSQIQRLLAQYEAVALDETYGADVTYLLQLPQEQADGIQQALLELTSGAALFEVNIPKHGSVLDC